MDRILDIITITKDDIEGVTATIQSTGALREGGEVRQIIVDSSRAELREKIKGITLKEQNVEYVWEGPSGIARAFNLGLSLSKAEWIWFLNGKDEVHDCLNRKTLLYILNESQADAIIFEIELMQSGIRCKHPPMWAQWPPFSAWIPHPATLTRKRLFMLYGDFDESFSIAMDFDFWLRCLSEKVIVDTISLPLAKFDITGLSYTQINKVSHEATRIIKKHSWKIAKTWLHNGLVILKCWRNFSKKAKIT